MSSSSARQVMSSISARTKKCVGARARPWDLTPDYTPFWGKGAADEIPDPDEVTSVEFMQCFGPHDIQEHLDIYTKLICLKASKSVVSVECYSGQETVSQCSGFIVKSDANHSIILTSAWFSRASMTQKEHEKIIVRLSDGTEFPGHIKARDFYYGVAALEIQSAMPLPTASLSNLKDSVSIDPSHNDMEEALYQFERRSDSFALVPGDLVMALGRFPYKPYPIMAAPGLFSIDRDLSDHGALFTVSCIISRYGIGGPLINRFGEVIGVCQIDHLCTRFLPVNVVSLWWQHLEESLKKPGDSRLAPRPYIGMEVTNIYDASIEILEMFNRAFPDLGEGVIVDEVVPGSSADKAGIECDDVIVEFDGENICSVLNLFRTMWNKVGQDVMVVLKRASDGSTRRPIIKVEENQSKTMFSGSQQFP